MNIFYSAKKHLEDRSWLRLSNEKYRLRQYFVLYTALFVFMCCIVFCWYFFTGRTFIWEQDGWAQHYKALIYYAQYMNSITRELLHNHRFVFPEWGFALGEGNDILQTLHYYVIGDPFSLFSVFVPTHYLWIYYDFMILLRLYLSGIAFSCLCFYTRKNMGRYAVMAGTLSYVFCSWAIVYANRHPYFLNPMLYFPLIILGIEKILRKEKPYLLIVSVFLASISNFYFFYNIVFMTAAYVAVRLIIKYKKDFRTMLNALMRIAGGSILGTTMGGIILFPVAFAFLNDARMDSGITWHLLYPLSHYTGLLRAFFSGDGSWISGGFAAPVILAVFLLFMRKKQHQLLKIYFLVCSVIILIPALGQFLNGMSYMSNKWCWAFALLCAYIFSVMWPELMKIKTPEALKLAFFLGICFLGMLMLEYSRTAAAFACIGFAFLFLFVIFPFQMDESHDIYIYILYKKYKQAIALMLVIASIANVSFFKNAAATGNYAKEAKEVAYVDEQLMLTEANAVQSVADSDNATGFYRYSGPGRSLTDNAGMLYDMSNTNYYWSISNPAINLFRRTMEMLETSSSYNYQGYDDRAALISLSSVKYYVAPYSYNSPIPYGFTYVDSFNVKESITEEAKALLLDELGVDELSDSQIQVIEDATASTYKVYRNENALPICYVYDAIISQEGWDSLSAIKKQEAMLQAVLLAEYDGNTQDNTIDYSSQSLDYSIKCDSNGVTLEDYGFVVTAANSSVTVSFDGIADSETYIVIKGLGFDAASSHDLYFGDEKYDPLNLFSETRWNLLSYADREAVKKEHLFWTEPTTATLTLQSSAGVSKTVIYYKEDSPYYSNRHDFAVNLDYTKKAVTSITITFPAIGIYSFDSIECICQPMDRYKEQVAALKESVLKNVDISTDTISGNISLDKPQVLCFSVPYSVGWTAYVDGKNTPLYQANIKNMALVLDAGKHSIKLVYHTPYLRIGAKVSAAGFMVFFLLLLIDIFKKRKSPAPKRRDS